MQWKTRITEQLGIEYPIISGALLMLGRVELAAAVSEAGGLGMITAWGFKTPERLRAEIRKCRSLTSKPFAVNLSPCVDPVLGPLREVAIEERVAMIETAGYRAEDHGKRIKESGILWYHKVQTVRHALAAERAGADAVCIMGLEGAGLKSPNMLTTFVSIPLAARALKIPVIAAGGIGDSRTFLGALALGAEGVMMGTAFCAVKECPLSERRKQALVDADPYDPKWRDPILSTPTMEELQNMVKAQGSGTDEINKVTGKAEARGIPTDAGIDTASLAIAFIDRVPTAKELIDSIIQGAEDILVSKGIGGFRARPDPARK